MTTYMKDISSLIQYFENACKPKSEWRIGTEHEKFLFNIHTKKRLGYDTNPGIRNVLEGLVDTHTSPIMEQGHIIGLKSDKGGNVSLEPGGQFELSGAPLPTVHDTYIEIKNHIQSVGKICADLGVESVCLGYDPLSDVSDIQWIPKGRYALMKQYMPTKGKLGLDMMTMSCTVQVNLDYGDEDDMRKKMQVSNALQPLSTALWANSTFVKGALTPYQSYRSHLWTDTDPERCGIPKIIFDADFSFEKWVDYLLDIPMYFVYDKGTYYNALGLSFRDFMQGKLKGFEGRYPTLSDWEDHLTVAFPEVRMKGFIEMRGADTGCLDMLCALPAFWVGLLYDEDVLNTVHDFVSQFSYEDIIQCRNSVAKMGFDAPFANQNLGDIMEQVLQYSKRGLKKRGQKNIDGQDETIYLSPLETIFKTRMNLAQKAQQTTPEMQDILQLGVYMKCT